MSRLYEQWRPVSIDDVVGQPAIVRAMKTFLLEPYPTAMIYVGGTGVGKTSLAAAMANALTDAGWFGRSEYCEIGANFKTEKAEYYFGPETPFRYSLSPGKYHVCRIEELERLPPNVQGNLKEAIEDFCRRYRLILIATSNDVSKLERAFLDRFQRYNFDSGIAFASACMQRLAQVCAIENIPAPDYAEAIDDEGNFSMRRALDLLDNVRLEATL